MQKILSLILFALCTFASGCAISHGKADVYQQRAQDASEHVMSQADWNSDGFINQKEWDGYARELSVVFVLFFNFGDFDKNSDGLISNSEFVTKYVEEARVNGGKVNWPLPSF